MSGQDTQLEVRQVVQRSGGGSITLSRPGSKATHLNYLFCCLSLLLVTTTALVAESRCGRLQDGCGRRPEGRCGRRQRAGVGGGQGQVSGCSHGQRLFGQRLEKRFGESGKMSLGEVVRLLGLLWLR